MVNYVISPLQLKNETQCLFWNFVMPLGKTLSGEILVLTILCVQRVNFFGETLQGKTFI